ncbi:hypothetical protein [Nocardia terpenica]|uniref:Uncharacterized protein n=1 Tax=Nocardia terpenica TaxID=455432 RepID=A0A164HBP0_9NOCA|nr:hypothetical protein [Nocardia terpenica]KZM68371.1 hypothetical protein AWN90_10820 [Nocardia terpenica]NQE88711.1 hypothetical protein [Nocardia terpenica]
MAEAVVHIDELGGYAGPARCYKLSPPVRLDGTDHEYVTVWVQPRLPHQNAEVAVVAATGTGACATLSLIRQPGSHVLHTDPATGEDVHGCHAKALDLLGYRLTQPGPAS